MPDRAFFQKEVRVKATPCRCFLKAVRFPNKRGQLISGILHRPEEQKDPPAILICHGMLSNKDSRKHIHLARTLCERGYLMLRFDFSFVGESEGELSELTYTGEVEDLRSAVTFIRGETRGAIGLVGSSMGGAVALLYAAEDPGVRALAVLACVARPGTFPEEDVSRWEAKGHIDSPLGPISLAFLKDAREKDALGAAARLKAPLLLIHGEADELIPATEALDLFRAARPPKRLDLLGGADHRFSEDSHVEEIGELISGWFERYLPP